jgi:hypothetical protein
VAGYEHAAAKAIRLAEKKPASEALSAPQTATGSIEILNAIQALKDQLDSALKASAGEAEEILETVRSIHSRLTPGEHKVGGSILDDEANSLGEAIRRLNASAGGITVTVNPRLFRAIREKPGYRRPFEPE